MANEDHVHDSGNFSATFPLPLRILSLISLGIAAWATNLHLLAALGIDTAQVLDVRASDHSGYAPLSLGASTTSATLHLHPSRLHPPVYKLALASLLWTLFGWLSYSAVSIHLQSYDQYRLATFVPAAFLFLAVAALVLPTNTLCRRERGMLLRSLQRTIFDGVFSPVPFCDVITADILTSFAKVIGDVWISVGLLVNTDTREAWGGQWGVPLLTSLPYMLRFRQCIAEFLTTPPTYAAPSSSLPSSLHPVSANTPQNPRLRSLCNALKYASAFPVILLSAVQGRQDLFQDASEDHTVPPTSHFIFKVWVAAVLFNSAYSFWWDVTNDWGLSLFIPSAWRSPPSFIASSIEKLPFASPASGSSRATASAAARPHRLHGRARSIATVNRSVDEGQDFVLQPPRPPSPSRHAASTTATTTAEPKSPPPAPCHSTGPFLRPQILMPDPWIYYAAIAIDLLLRLTWSLKLSSHLHAIHELEQGVYLMEALEVVRRWMWTFIRIEWEAVKRSDTAATAAAGAGTGAYPEVLFSAEDIALQQRFSNKAMSDSSGLGISGVAYDDQHAA